MTRYTKASQTGDAAEYFACAKLTRDLGYVCRLNTGPDTGVDAYVELVIDERATGAQFALQVKGTAKYGELEAGKIAAYVDARHVEYWTNHKLTVLYAIVDVGNFRIWLKEVRSQTDLKKTEKGYRLDVDAVDDLLENFKISRFLELAMPARGDAQYRELLRIDKELEALSEFRPTWSDFKARRDHMDRLTRVRRDINVLEGACRIQPEIYSSIFMAEVGDLEGRLIRAQNELDLKEQG